MHKKLLQRAQEIGLVEDKYRFVWGPEGFEIDKYDYDELSDIAAEASRFIGYADKWYRSKVKDSGCHILSTLQRGIPKQYLPLGFGRYRRKLPRTMMIDAVWTTSGWCVVEIDVTNRNGLGFPLVMRHLYGLPSIWRGNDIEWRDGGFERTIQIMAHYCRFYEPYYRFFLNAIGGTLIHEHQVMERLPEILGRSSLLDLPVFHKGEFIDRLVELASDWDTMIGIPPKHHLSSKALLSLPWEVEEFRPFRNEIHVPCTMLLRTQTELPKELGNNFFVKLLQSGGAHGTFHNDRTKLEELRNKRPQAIVQDSWRIAKRPISFLNGDKLEKAGKFIRFSLYVNVNGAIVDADVTASDEPIVHGGNRSIMTVPVLK